MQNDNKKIKKKKKQDKIIGRMERRQKLNEGHQLRDKDDKYKCERRRK